MCAWATCGPQTSPAVLNAGYALESPEKVTDADSGLWPGLGNWFQKLCR